MNTRPARHRISGLLAAIVFVGSQLSCSSSPTSGSCTVTHPEIVPASLTLKVGTTSPVAFSADYSVQCQAILVDEGVWTSSDLATVSVAQNITNPLVATAGGVKVGGPVIVTFVGGPLGVAKTTATVSVTVVP